jgi:hypothetical protein
MPLGLLLTLSVAVPAAAGSAFQATGILRDSAGRVLSVYDTEGDAALHGKTVTVYLTSSTRVTRDGRRTSAGALQNGDRLSASGRRDRRGRLVASVVDAKSPPRPDGPALSQPQTCTYYYLCVPPLPPPTNGSGRLAITISNYVFDPPVSVVPVGTIVTVRNSDGVAHTFSGNNLDSGPLSGTATFSVEFTTRGTYRFFCAYHPFMNGVLEVE